MSRQDELVGLRRDERDVASWDVECDVLIVGSGAAGSCAAIEAAQAGARVILLERAGGTGGTSAMSGGILYLGGGTPLQKACGFEDSPEEMFKYMMAACGPYPDESLIEPYCEGSVEHFHWLVDKGVPYKPSFFEGAHEPFTTDDGLTYSGSEHVHPFNQLARPAPRGHIPQQVRNKGAVLMQCLSESVERAGVETRLQHRCSSLVTASDDRVIGATASSLDGEIAIRALRGVVLTAGGFICNRRMLERYAPLLGRCKMKVGTEHDDGLGIRLGLAAGGEAIRMDAGDISLAIFPPNQLRQGLFVNARAQRYLNEDAYFGRHGEFALLHQDGRVWLIVDDDIYAQPELAPLEVAAVGETIAEIEAEIGFAPGALQETVAYYNRHAERGEDPLLHKLAKYVKPLVTPPFAALDVGVDSAVYSAFTLGGLRIDPNGAVLRASGAPVPGLYAAGRTTSGVAKQGYSSGMSLGDGTFFGRRAGRHVASAR